jgi:hypothetical protein
MRQIEDEAGRERRARLVARGAPAEYNDAELYATVERALRAAVERRNPDGLLLPELLGDEEEWKLKGHLTWSSHRTGAGPILFVKRRILLPLMRWLYEFSLDNFRRQERVNQALFACIETLAIENADLRRRLAAYESRTRPADR